MDSIGGRIALNGHRNRVSRPGIIKKLQKTVALIYKNRTAFVLLAIGYGLGIFGQNDGHGMYIAGVVLVLTGVIIVLIGKFCSYLARKWYPDDEKIPYETVSDHVETVVTDAEIDAMFDDVFNDPGRC